MKIDITVAQALATSALGTMGYTADEGERIAAHLIDCELRGLGFSGLARVLSIAERHQAMPALRQPMTILRVTPISGRATPGTRACCPTMPSVSLVATWSR